MTTNYELFRQAILQGKQVSFIYQGHRRETCPHAIGLKNGLEKVLTFQFAGGTNTELPPGGQWRCIFISEVKEVQVHDGPWHTRETHGRPQTCIDQVDVEVRVAPDGTPYAISA